MIRRFSLIFGIAFIGGAQASNFGQEHDQALPMDQRVPAWQRTSPGVNSVAPGANATAARANDPFVRPRDGSPRPQAPALTPPPVPGR